MIDTPIKPIYDLEKRTLQFSKDVRDFVHVLPKNITNREYSSQLIRYKNFKERVEGKYLLA